MAATGVHELTSDPDSSVFVIATCQSQHTLSRHYGELRELRLRGECISLMFDPDLARAGATGVTRLLSPMLE